MFELANHSFPGFQDRTVLRGAGNANLRSDTTYHYRDGQRRVTGCRDISGHGHEDDAAILSDGRGYLQGEELISHRIAVRRRARLGKLVGGRGSDEGGVENRSYLTIPLIGMYTLQDSTDLIRYTIVYVLHATDIKSDTVSMERRCRMCHQNGW